jgi:predicted enzyme related to lactoylglutathione lyase
MTNMLISYRKMFLALVVGIAGCATQPVPSITTAPTETWDPGGIVWADLLTDDVATARAFYSGVFGWQFIATGEDEYLQATNNGKPVAGIAYHAPRDPKVSEVVWLVSISVDDVDVSAAAVSDAGGEILESPRNVPNRGRFSIVADNEDAVLVFLKASGGDPINTRSVDNEWIWAELWGRDPGSAAQFYAATVGYESKVVVDTAGDDYRVLLRNGKPKTGIVKLPWDDVDSHWLPYLRVADVGATVERVKSAGGKVLVAPSMDYDEGRVAIVSDPTGGVFAIQSRRSAQ